MFTKDFWIDLTERSIATFAQTLAALLIAAGTGILDTEWQSVLSVALMAGLLAVLKAIGANAYDEKTGGSMGTTIPKGTVAAVEEAKSPSGYVAEEASTIDEGEPVEVEPAFFIDYNDDLDHTER